MRDILPQDAGVWTWIGDTCRRIAESYGFSMIETPLLEDEELFRRSVGETSDIVKKEMFAFNDQGGDAVALRPEFTASIARAYIEHGLINQPKPIKLYEIGACFRHERPQSGRLRQFHQFNAEIIGNAEPAVDAELMSLAYFILKQLGLDVIIQVNSLGDVESRKRYIKRLKEYFQPKLNYLPKEDQDKFKTNPLRLLDSKNKRSAQYAAEAPQIVDFLDDESKAHLMQVLEYLDSFDLPYTLNPRIVRGLDYYTRTAFEIWVKDDEEGSRLSALGGGGRYDGLIDMLGGRETPAAGFAIGLERVIAKIREKNNNPPVQPMFDIFLAHLGEDARKKIFKLYDMLHSLGYKVTYNIAKTGLKQQLELANKLKVRLTLIFGEKEVNDNEILIKEMEVGAQESVPLKKLQKELDKRLLGREISQVTDAPLVSK